MCVHVDMCAENVCTHIACMYSMCICKESLCVHGMGVQSMFVCRECVSAYVCVCVCGSLPKENQGLALACDLGLFLRKAGHYSDPSDRKKGRWVWLPGLSPVEKGFPLG